MTASGDVFAAQSASATLRFGAQNPDHPWWSIADRLIEVLGGFSRPLLPGVRWGLYTPSALQGARNNPVEVAAGDLDVAITTPAATAWMAAHGAGVYDRPHEGLRAIASYPHIDYVVFMVDAAFGIGSLRELAEQRVPLRVVTGRKAQGEQDVLTFLVDQVLARHGASFDAIESWGGEVIYGGPTHIGGHVMREGRADALFQEAQMADVFDQIADSRDVTVLAVDEDVIAEITRDYGVARAEVPAGRYRGVTSAVPTVDFSGWLVMCREDLPERYAYALAQACEAIVPQLPTTDEVRRALTYPIDTRYMFGETAIPLHRGAERYARERGLLG